MVLNKSYLGGVERRFWALKSVWALLKKSLGFLYTIALNKICF
jgi:hypothetical protein